MTQSNSHASPSHGSEPSNAAQYMPNTGMYMGQSPWPQPAYIPHPGFYYPYSVPLNTPRGAAPQHALVAPLPGVGPGVAHHALQAGQTGYCSPAVAVVSHVTYIGPYPPPTVVAPPPQQPSAPPLYHQPIPSSSCPGATNTYAPPVPHQGHLHQHHGPGLPTACASSVVPQVSSLSVGQKRVAEDLKGRDGKRTKIGSGGIKNDPLFKPVLNRFGQPTGTFVCTKDGMLLNPESYLKHVKTKRHLGYKLEKFKCPGCSKTYSRRDACKRHWNDGCGKLAPEGARLSYSAACRASKSSASAAPVTAPTTAFTYSCPYPMAATSMYENVQFASPASCITQWRGTPSFANPVLSKSPENDTVAEPADDDEDDDDADFWEANEIQDMDEM